MSFDDLMPLYTVFPIALAFPLRHDGTRETVDDRKNKAIIRSAV